MAKRKNTLGKGFGGFASILIIALIVLSTLFPGTNKTQETTGYTTAAAVETTAAATDSAKETIADDTQTVQNTNNDSTGKRTDWTEWNESLYPEFYRIVGSAVIDVTLAPGEIRYSGLDDLGRTGPVEAYLTYEDYEKGRAERSDISSIKPSGWTSNKEVAITFEDGTVYHGYFYNRSHLLAHSLGGDDEKYNMVTGTRCQNVGKNDGNGGMQYSEMTVYNYLKNDPDGQVYYLVTPVYEGSELVPRSVIVDMRSDDGQIDQEVEVYNTAPEFTIDYATGEYSQSA